MMSVLHIEGTHTAKNCHKLEGMCTCDCVCMCVAQWDHVWRSDTQTTTCFPKLTAEEAWVKRDGDPNFTPVIAKNPIVLNLLPYVDFSLRPSVGTSDTHHFPWLVFIIVQKISHLYYLVVFIRHTLEAVPWKYCQTLNRPGAKKVGDRWYKVCICTKVLEGFGPAWFCLCIPFHTHC